MPAFDESHKLLQSHVTDFISRCNVHKFSGQPAFESDFDQRVSQDFDLSDPYWVSKLAHVREHALFFIFDKDPSFEKLEQIKSNVQTESSEARAKREEQAEKSESASSEEEGPKVEWEKPEEIKENDPSLEPEPLTSMGCGFRAEDFQKLKLELDKK